MLRISGEVDLAGALRARAIWLAVGRWLLRSGIGLQRGKAALLAEGKAK
jgi:hypothetical protein